MSVRVENQRGTIRDRSAVRWPWVVFSTFVMIAIVVMSLVVANDDALGEQLPLVEAISMFGVIGALILSREPRNVIGGLLLYGSRT